MKKPITIEEAEERKLLALKPRTGIHTFSNGTAGYGWMDCNCFECHYYPMEGPAGELCAFEAAMMAGWVTPELAEMFGWTRSEKYPDSWHAPRLCPFFKQRPDPDDNGDVPPPPPDPDPLQLVLIVDPSEDIALAKAIEQHVDSPDELLPV
jgi:hypothetical protein